MKEERDIIEELFKLSDIKAGLENVRSLGHVVVRSFFQIGRELALPLKLAFNISNDKKFNEILTKHKALKRDYNSEMRQRLRSLGAFEVDPEMLLYNPVGFLLTFPINAYAFMMDDEGADEMPPFYEKLLRDLGSDTRKTADGLSALEKIFYESKNAVEDLISEQAEKPDGLTPKAVDEILSYFGIDAKAARDEYFDSLIDMLDQMKSSLESRTQIIEKMKQVNDIKSLQAFINSLASMGVKIDVSEIKKQIEKLSSENPEDEDIASMMAEIIDSGTEELKSQLTKSTEDLPDEEMLKASDDDRAKKALQIISDIKTLAGKI